jgi:endogenous inhibitor of DNA gyrase (YacG/DUF329 family)
MDDDLEKRYKCPHCGATGAWQARWGPVECSECGAIENWDRGESW